MHRYELRAKWQNERVQAIAGKSIGGHGRTRRHILHPQTKRYHQRQALQDVLTVARTDVSQGLFFHTV
jgi:hypothetical protein